MSSWPPRAEERQLLRQRLSGVAGRTTASVLSSLAAAARGCARRRALRRQAGTSRIAGSWISSSRQGRGQHPPVGREPQAQRLGPDIHAGGNVLAPVNAVAGGPDDLRHVRPDRVETRPMKSAAIAGARDRNPAGVGLVPGSQQDVRPPVFVPHVQEFRVDRDAQQPLGAALNAGEAGFALVQCFDRRQRVAIVGGFVPVDVVEAAQLDAVGAARAVLPPIDIAELADAAEPRRRRDGVNVVAIGHTGPRLGQSRFWITVAASASHPPHRMWMPRTPGMALSAAAISAAMATPSLRQHTRDDRHFLVQPRLATASIHCVKPARSDTACVSRKSAPAAIFFLRRSRLNSMGCWYGWAAAPTSHSGRGSMVCPLKPWPVSIIFLSAWVNWTESISYTPAACGQIPRDWWSPLMQKTVSMPSAAAPRASFSSAMRLRSRVTIESTLGGPPPPGSRRRPAPNRRSGRNCPPPPPRPNGRAAGPTASSPLRRRRSTAADIRP